MALVEDDDRLRANAATVLDEAFGFTVVGFRDVPPRVARRFDVVVLDLKLTETEGEETVRRCKEAFGVTPIVVWTGDTSRARRRTAIQAGAEAVVTKGDPYVHLVDAIDQVHARDTRPFNLEGLAADRDRLGAMLDELVAMGT